MKFKYGDKVKVTEGFYEGLVGIVSDFNITLNSYYVEMSSIKNELFTEPRAWIDKGYLEKLK